VAAISDDAQRRNELIERGYERARAFSWDACVTRLLTAMEQAQSE
jgi:glycosyltransferase involved in cell wall biosynthesis